MTSPTAGTTPAAVPGTAAIRAGIAILATFAFALSYDALRQMAVAIHIRGLLTYAFPLVIDGFIAIGVGALLMLRTAPLHARAYVWALVGAATTTSIWANALHAVRLNQQQHQGSNFRLDDLTVGILSAIAPLALAGAVHLYLVIRRHPGSTVQESAATSSHVDRTHATTRHSHATQRPELTHTPRSTDADPTDVAPDVTTPRAAQPSGHTTSVRQTRVPEELLAIARTAPLGRGGRASRRHIEAEIRQHGHTIGRADAEAIKRALQDELDNAAQHRPRPATAPIGAD